MALTELGDIDTAQGDLTGARKAYEDGLDTRRHLAAADPRNAGLQRDVSVSLERLGDVLTAQGDLAGARKAYEEGLDIIRCLAAADPSNAGLQRDIWVSLWRFAKITGSGVTWAQVLAALEDGDHRGLLAPSDRPFLDQARRNAAAAPAP